MIKKQITWLWHIEPRFHGDCPAALALEHVWYSTKIINSPEKSKIGILKKKESNINRLYAGNLCVRIHIPS